MTAFGFQRSRVELQEEAWGPLQRALHRWVIAHGGSLLLAYTAAWASLADARADAALALAGPDASWQGMPALSEDEIDALRREPMVGDGSSDVPTAFVIDAQVRFYLWRNYSRERRIGQRLRELRQQPMLSLLDASPIDEVALDMLFGDAASGDDSAQRAAVRQLSHRRFGVLTGGPGTGKTTTVLRMLLMAQRHRQQAGLSPARIAIAATTGKAAQRLLTSLQDGKRALQSRLPASDTSTDTDSWNAHLTQLPASDALTLHSLLGYHPYDGRFSRGRDLPLDADIVVVDEASMLDLSLLDALLEALPETAQLFLVGDADQLTSIGTGSVLLDLVAAMEGSDDLVRLRHGFRAQSPELPRLLAAARTGDVEGFKSAFDGVDTVWRRVVTPVQLDARLHAWAERLANLPPLRQGRASNQVDALAALDALASHQLLCALREGGYGAVHANFMIEHQLRLQWQQPAQSIWYPGRAVMVTRNDYASKLFNGDVGICLADAEGGLRVWFEAAVDVGVVDDGARRARAFSPAALPAHESAFAITVHKSQGSEYANVALLLPPAPQHQALTRQLIYTGLSRARQAVELWSGAAALATALATPVRRIGGLRDCC
ncbi:exodeoxyribonuclease V subunit alpha [Thermomonas sp.]|uniref:exodeoxyribonuclease V subunit alpha n=1 Tax=Thermomonas sp. TaxID=1971895 RepID=UPI00248A3B03|nr:exodeoxyribonuclease V subunit alpha [Thermomonas sp.]MDI1252300.1 exodeoxyribonuclease V subunit alpha [Thermomonas sp.]